MTSLPQTSGLQQQAPTSQVGSQGQPPSGKSSPPATVPTPTAPRSYASATKKSFSQAATGDSANASTPPSGPQGTQHGKSLPTAQVNGKSTMQNNPVSGAGGPTIVNGNTSANDHVRKPSVTISAAGATGFTSNGGPVSGRTSNIRFGAVDSQGSPALANAVLANQSQSTLGVSPVNNRITSPDSSPSPIPQTLSGGRQPPSHLQAPGSMVPNFGNFGGDHNEMNRNMRPVSQTLPHNGPPSHGRRESVQSAHGDMGNHSLPSGPAGRGGYQGGRGRGFNQSQVPYGQTGSNYRGGHNSRGGSMNFHSPRQSLGPFPSSPHQTVRSPALQHAKPATPPMTHVPMANPQMQPPPYGYQPHMGPQGYPVVPGYDNTYYYQQPYQYHHMQMGHMPQHPRQPFMPAPGPYPANQYGAQAPPAAQGAPLSRSTSQISATDRPSSSLSHGQQSSAPISQAPALTPSRTTSSPAPNPQFVVPPKKVIVTIKDPDSGDVLAFDKQAAPSPARAAPSPVKLGTTPTATPPPRAASRGDQEQQDQKAPTSEERIQSFQEQVRLAAVQAAAKEQKAAEQKLKKDEPEPPKAAPEPKEPVATPAKEPEVPSKEPEKKEEPKPAEPEEEEIDFDAIERELAAKEAEELEREKAYEEKKRKEKEEAARKAKEEEEAYKTNLKKLEREAEAAEEERLRKLAAGEGETKKAVASPQPKVETPSESPAIHTPAESGAATPVSEASMGPPKTLPGGKREKPAALKLETNKTVEPPQPSAALKSLQTARFLEDPSKITYPSSIVSPNPALNTNAPADRKFKYNKEFLLQFQNVFKEKPSLDWDTKVRETVGDTSSDSRPGMRTPLSGRTASRPGAGNTMDRMGSFVGPGRTQTMPSGGHDRFPISGMRGPALGGNFGQFGRPGGLTMGAPMSRTNSSSAQHIPGSPRSGSHRGGGGRSASKAHKNTRKEEDTNKNMPLTAGLKIEPLAPSSSGWKPRSIGKATNDLVGPDGHLPPDVVQRKVKANLNKMTPEKFDKIADQILAIVAQSKDESDGRTLRQVIQLTFEKATDEAHWASLYARFCMRMLESMSPEIKDENIRDKHNNVVCGGSLFRKYLLNRCQEEFERGWKVNLPPKPEGESDEAAMLSDEYYIAAAAKRRGLGLVKFIGELFKLSMLSDRIMHECVKKLVDYEGIPDEAEIESLTSLLRTIGATLDRSTEKGHMMMNAYFDRINKMIQTPGLPSRLRFMLMDIVDLRKANWVSKDADKGPKTIQEIREEAARAQQEQEMERRRQQASRGSGGMGPGRGDARHFSGGYGNQPPLDYASSKVGSDDLRRLKAPRTTTQPSSFGPSSLLASRSSSGRRAMGPGGNLVRGGEDSGASSRTGTPPAGKKDDKETASTNAFSALASLDNGDSLATSPPSNPTSPQLTKSRPAVEQPTSQGKDDSAGAS